MIFQLRQIIDLLAIDKSRYFAQSLSITVNCFCWLYPGEIISEMKRIRVTTTISIMNISVVFFVCFVSNFDLNYIFFFAVVPKI